MATKGADTRYVVYMPHGPKALEDAFRVATEATVRDLGDMICNHRTYKLVLKDKDEELYLLKCGDLLVEPADTLFDRVKEWLRGGAERALMRPANDLEEYFPTGPAPAKDKKIDIVLVTDSILESPDVVYALPDKRILKVTEERRSQANKMWNFSPPSEGVKSQENLKEWVNESSGVHIHRPAGNHGPPTALFHPALAKLKHLLTHLNQVEEPSADHYRRSHEFITLGSNGFKKENLREGALKVLIRELIGETPEWQQSLEDKKAIPDAVWGGETTRAILELKNLDGVGGNATLQGVLDYAKILAQSKYRKYLASSNCPAIVIGIMGSRLEIATVVFTDGVYADKLLSEDLCIDPWQSDTVLRVGRIFKALSLAIAELRDYYENLANDPNLEPIAMLYPSPLPVEDVDIPRLMYLGKLSHAGELLREGEKIKEERPYALYRAKMIRDESGDEVDVVVKFTVRYHEKAHRMLAENQLAPTLHFCTPLVGGMFMVIMDYIEGTPLFLVRRSRGPEVYGDMERAIGLLHEEELVFGDLRTQNVISKAAGGAMLIDFDWVGKHQVDRYPASWNDENTWAPGVARRALMDKAHDTFMLGKAKAFLGLAK